MGIAGKYKITVNFIRHYKNLVFKTYLCKFFKFIFMPDSTDRVVRTAKNKKLYVVFLYFVFKIFKVYFIAAIFKDKAIFYKFTLIHQNSCFKRMINWRLNQNGFTFPCQSLNCHCNCKHNTWSFYKPFRLYIPAMTIFHPCRQSCKIFSVRLYISITVNTMFHSPD